MLRSAMQARGIAALSAKAPLVPWEFKRREVGDDDVLIDAKFCGCCHSDVHQVRDEWGGSKFPMVPGHEVVGIVSAVGKNVKHFKAGDRAGVGCMVGSCGKCRECSRCLEQFCKVHCSFTYNGTELDQKTPTYGGYSNKIVCTEKFVFRIPDELDLAAAAPLLCAGITTYSPLVHFKVKKNDKIAIVGLGGLGHIGIKLAAAMGAEVWAITTSASKADDAKRLGAHGVVVSTNPADVAKHANSFSFILNTISAEFDMKLYLNMLAVDGTMCLVGVPEKPLKFEPWGVIDGRKTVAGSLIGGTQETQDMLDFCAKQNPPIVCDIELIDAKYVNEAYERMVKAQVKYRFVIDCKTI